MNSVLNQYYNLFVQLVEKENEIKKNEMIHDQLLQEARLLASQREIRYKQELTELIGLEDKINRYEECANRYAKLERYNAKPQLPDMDELYRCYTVISGPSQVASFYAQYARRLLEMCCDARQYIQLNKGRILQNITMLQYSVTENGNVKQNERNRQSLESQIRDDILPKMVSEIQSATELESKYYVNANEVYNPTVPDRVLKEMCLGHVVFPHPTNTFCSKMMREKFSMSSLYTEDGIKVPFGFSAEKLNEDGMYDVENIQVWYNNETRAEIHKIVQGIAFNILRNYPPLCGRITYVDFGTFNDEYLASMRCFTEENSLIQFPRNINQVKTVISRLNAETVAEAEKSRHRRFLIIKDDIDHGMSSQFAELFANISNNATKNNVVTIWLRCQNENRKVTGAGGQILIHAKENRFYLSMPDTDREFDWFNAPCKLNRQAVEAFQKQLFPEKLSNEYENFFPLNEQVAYVRDRRPIKLPYGMSDKGELQYLTCEGMEFASFIMGASGSGKSTLLHALIAGIIRDYHPDEVELWLADLKMMEFANYTHHMPPHIKYILMDSSKEMVYDFIDLLYVEMERRQSLLAAYGTNDCKNLPRDKYLPILFVIIDEFSTLSDAIRDDEIYKRKLEQILVRGRGPGLRLIFSSQSYTYGAPALTSLAKEQIQTRIAMKNTPEEIKLTMALPSGEMTDSILHDINTLPEHVALRCVQEKSGLHRVDKAHGLYFDGRDEEGWKSRFELIDRVNQQMTAVTLAEFDPDKINQYVEKKPIIVSSKILQAFNKEKFNKETLLYRREPDNMVFDDDMLIRFGQPRKLENNLFTVMTNEAFENVFLLAGNREIICGTSVIMSTIRSFLYQKGSVQIWAHPRNRVYHWYKDSHFSSYKVSLGTEAVREAIDDLRIRIQNREKANELIVLLGMDNICPELNDSADDGFSVAPLKEIKLSETLNSVFRDEQTNKNDIPERDTSELKNNIMNSIEEIDDLYEKFEAEQLALGKTEEQIDEAFTVYYAEYFKKNYDMVVKPDGTTKKDISPNIPIKSHKDYMKDFQQLLRVGSRWGYHFMVCVSSFQAIQTMGLNIKMFNHRLSFKTDSTDTSMSIFNNSSAFRLSEHTCYYSTFGSSEGSYAITPYLHPGVTWNNWIVDEEGIARDGAKL